MGDIVIAKATGSPWSEVLGHPEGHLNGQDRRTFGPWHLSLFGRQHRFRFRISPPDGSGEPWRSTEAGNSCQPAFEGCRCATLPLPLVCLSRDWQGWGPEGAYAQLHEFPSKIRSQVRVTSVEGYGQLGGRDRWPTFGLLLCPRLAQAATRRSRACGPSLGKAVAHHGLSSASLSPPSDLTCSRKASEQPAQTLMRANLLMEAACHALEA